MRPPDDRRRRFEELYRANHDPVLGYVVRRTANGHDAADVFAETFLTVWRRLDDVPAGEKARPWLFGVARRVLANHHRGARRHTALTARLAAELSAIRRPGEEAAGADILARAFAELPDDYREVLSLADWEGLSAAEISKAGKVLFMEDGDDPAGRLEAVEGLCGEHACSVAVKVPENYRSYASIVFGRAAEQGEMYNTGPGDEPGEGIGLPGIDQYTVTEAVAILRARDVAVEYRYQHRGSDQPYPQGIPADKVDPDWYVHEGLLGSENQAILFVGPEPNG